MRNKINEETERSINQLPYVLLERVNYNLSVLTRIYKEMPFWLSQKQTV